MTYHRVIATLAILSIASGCSTRPRNFAPQIAMPIADTIGFERDYRTCAELVAQGRASDFKAAAATMGAAGAGVLGGAAVSVASVSAVGLTGAGMVATAALPGIGFLAGFAATRMIRSGKERKFKRRMEACLGEYGYTVGDWTRIGRRADAAAVALTTVQTPAPEAAIPQEAALAEKDGTAPMDRAAEGVR
jgi:hypothetical protein